jgi:DNA-directed RNA polymerase specialized sigma24 family protein
MFGLTTTPNHKPEPYATSTDFCRIFEQNMNRLYLLSLLLTADEKTAENCFVQGLDSSKSANPVFKEWAESWARRTIVQNAIQMVRPRPSDVVPSRSIEDQRAQPVEVAAVLALPAFDRFAYVLSVLEGYPLHECALLLDCGRNELISARMRALQQVVKFVEANRDNASNAPRDGTGSEHLSQACCGSAKFSHLAATA